LQPRFEITNIQHRFIINQDYNLVSSIRENVEQTV